jgi:predicted acylesterase/phospholipase RssA
VLDNLPVSTLTEPREGPVVAVSISFGGDSSGPAKDRTKPPRMPALGDTVLRSLMMGSAGAAAEARRAADLVISPASAGVGLLEFHQIDTMREAGRAATIEALPRLRALLDGTVALESTPMTSTTAIPVLSGS